MREVERHPLEPEVCKESLDSEGRQLLDRATTAANDSVRLHRRIHAVRTLIDRRAGTSRL